MTVSGQSRRPKGIRGEGAGPGGKAAVITRLRRNASGHAGAVWERVISAYDGRDSAALGVVVHPGGWMAVVGWTDGRRHFSVSTSGDLPLEISLGEDPNCDQGRNSLLVVMDSDTGNPRWGRQSGWCGKDELRAVAIAIARENAYACQIV